VALDKMLVECRVFLLQKQMVDLPATGYDGSELLSLLFLFLRARRSDWNLGLDKELISIDHQSCKQRIAIVLDVLGVKNNLQLLQRRTRSNIVIGVFRIIFANVVDSLWQT